MNLEEFRLSDQALGAIMMALQRSLLEQSDIVPTLKGLKLVSQPNNELVVLNPPIVKAITPEMLENADSEDD
tara:strand:- start:554 stop:769 length:216 start_codon:yes stop_codon:yes gene_type:complete